MTSFTATVRFFSCVQASAVGGRVPDVLLIVDGETSCVPGLTASPSGSHGLVNFRKVVTGGPSKCARNNFNQKD
jgi:hypothetical protein